MKASWVAIDLMEFAVRTEDAVQSPEAALEWLRSFRDTLLMEGRNSRPMPWAVELLGLADVKIAKKSIARMQGQIVKIYGKDCDVDLECSKKYGEKYEKLKNILAAASTSDGVDESTTGCKPLPSNPLTEPPRSGAKSGKNLTGADAVDGDTTEAIYSGENRETEASGPSASTETQAAPSPLLEVSEKSSGEGAVTVPAKVQKKTPHGEFKNVMLTTAEVNSLCEKLGVSRAKELVEELSQYMASKGKKYKSHYATLLNWSRRKAQESKPKQGYMTSDDISKKNYQESKARLEAMFSGGRRTA